MKRNSYYETMVFISVLLILYYSYQIYKYGFTGYLDRKARLASNRSNIFYDTIQNTYKVYSDF